jgi:(methylthio)acryloyl-CoA hydratase
MAEAIAGNPLALERIGPVLMVGLDRPHKRNALNDEIIAALDACFADFSPARISRRAST